MRYYWGIVLISLGIVVMVLDPFDKLDAYLRGTANTVPTATLLGLAALTTVVALCVAFKSSLRFRPHLLPHVVAFRPHAGYGTCRKGPGAQARDDGENGARGLLRRWGGAAIHCLLVFQGRVRDAFALLPWWRPVSVLASAEAPRAYSWLALAE